MQKKSWKYEFLFTNLSLFQVFHYLILTMILEDFYALLDGEITQLVTDNKEDPFIKRHDPKKQLERKSYAFLIWFLRFYGQKPYEKVYITDGKDDMSCDIILSNKNAEGEEIFYVVQSKWIAWGSNRKDTDKAKSYPLIDKHEFSQTLSDFSTLLNGERKTANERFKQQAEKLFQHLKEKNGKVKFIFFTLAQYNPEIKEAHLAFNHNFAPNVSLEIIDIDRIRRDFVETRYKQIQSENPLEYHYDAEYGEIELEIERINNGGNGKSALAKRDFLEHDGRAKAYIFLLKPRTIWALFKKYKYGLFFKNVRNPIKESEFNKKIEETLLKRPNAFWYFNNGVTGISQFIPEVGIHARKIKLTGLQIINGAQTVYYIYKAYENASPAQRKVIDADARISLRLIRSSDEEFNLQITRYTNSQNPMSPRDFMANDDVQQRLQNESFKTNVWYEKRVGEFVTSATLSNISFASNAVVATTYLAFHLQKPVEAITKQDYLFISQKDDANGLYEVIFNENSRYEDMLASLNIYLVFLKTRKMVDIDLSSNLSLPTAIMRDVAKNMIDRPFFICLAISKIILAKYLEIKFPNEHKPANLSIFINKSVEVKEQNNYKLLFKIALYTYTKILKEDIGEVDYIKLISSPLFYQNIVEKIENNKDFTLDEIDKIEITNDMQITKDL